jgi:hypothetical protein
MPDVRYQASGIREKSAVFLASDACLLTSDLHPIFVAFSRSSSSANLLISSPAFGGGLRRGLLGIG